MLINIMAVTKASTAVFQLIALAVSLFSVATMFLVDKYAEVGGFQGIDNKEEKEKEKKDNK